MYEAFWLTQHSGVYKFALQIHDFSWKSWFFKHGFSLLWIMTSSGDRAGISVMSFRYHNEIIMTSYSYHHGITIGSIRRIFIFSLWPHYLMLRMSWWHASVIIVMISVRRHHRNNKYIWYHYDDIILMIYHCDDLIVMMRSQLPQRKTSKNLAWVRHQWIWTLCTSSHKGDAHYSLLDIAWISYRFTP